MKKLVLLLAMLLAMLLAGCEQKQEPETVKAADFTLPETLPGYMKQEDFEQIDWKKTASPFVTSSGSKMEGIKNKLGFIGPQLKAGHVQKWLWHFWGVSKGELAVAAYNKETKQIRPLVSGESWKGGKISSGEINGAEAGIPSSVMLTEPGKWALLVYVDGRLFETMVIDVKE